MFSELNSSKKHLWSGLNPNQNPTLRISILQALGVPRQDKFLATPLANNSKLTR